MSPSKPLRLEDIRELKVQGLSNTQIIKQLQKQGYSSTQIFDALNQEAIQQTMPGPGLQSQTNVQVQKKETPQPLNSSAGKITPMQEMPPTYRESPSQSASIPTQRVAPAGASNEEIIETIIDEKWNDLLEDVQRIISWKEKTTEQVTTLEQQLKDLKEQFERLHGAVIGKVGEYDQHILQVGAEVKAMEKVFSKVLPVFTENVGELSRITDSIKKSTAKKTTRK